MTDIAAILLAAGRSTRFAAASDAVATKLVAELDGKPLVRHAAEAALASKARPIFVVTGHADGEVRAVLDGLPLVFVYNPAFASGLASSLQAGVAALPVNAEGAVVLLGDMPRVSGELIDRLCAAFEGAPAATAVVPVIDGEKGNPVLVSRALFAAIATLSGDQGARKIIEAHRGLVAEVIVDDEAVRIDVDTPAVLAAVAAARRD